MSGIREKAIDGIKKSDSFCVKRKFTQKDMLDFADITRDYNPVHFDERFAKEKKFDDRICHGLLIGSILTEIGGQIGWLASEMNFKFKRPVYFGDTIDCDLTITEIDDNNRAKARALFRNQQGEIVIEAFISGILPGLKEREIMKTLGKAS